MLPSAVENSKQTLVQFNLFHRVTIQAQLKAISIVENAISSWPELPRFGILKILRTTYTVLNYTQSPSQNSLELKIKLIYYLVDVDGFLGVTARAVVVMFVCWYERN
jgi:hypothetical protein